MDWAALGLGDELFDTFPLFESGGTSLGVAGYLWGVLVVPMYSRFLGSFSIWLDILFIY